MGTGVPNSDLSSDQHKSAYSDLPDDLPPGEGTWLRVLTPHGIEWHRIDKVGATQAVWPPPEERR